MIMNAVSRFYLSLSPVGNIWRSLAVGLIYVLVFMFTAAVKRLSL